MHQETLSAGTWLNQLEHPTGTVRRALENIYGTDAAILEERLALMRRVIARFIERFGDRDLRIFRSPGRINLRGMHVDTHGGYLNLMTHQREIIAAVSPEPDDAVNLVNVNPRFEEVSFHFKEMAGRPAFAGEWLRFITHPDVQGAVLAQRGHWGNYLQGCVLSAQHRFPERRFTGMSGVIGGDLTRGAALSSSTALSVAVFLASAGCNGVSMGPDDLILAVKDAEWYTGARGGTSDQAAMILGGESEMVNVALLAEKLDTSGARRVSLPPELRVLVINSHTERSLSGAQVVDYTRNRFAYSLAMEIARQELRAQGAPAPLVEKIDRLPSLSPSKLTEIGGAKAVFGLLRRIPGAIEIDALRKRYDLPQLDHVYTQYFGTVPEEARPTSIDLRGPLLFGIAESERAQLFPDALEMEDFVRAGRLMSTGHDGDRRVNASGEPYRYDISDTALSRLATEGMGIEWCPGIYGASSPVLDALVDAALEAGALGASLTGAGIAGTVLALCLEKNVEMVAEAIRARIAAPDYPRLANRDAPLSDDEIACAATINHATAHAGEIVIR